MWQGPGEICWPRGKGRCKIEGKGKDQRGSGLATNNLGLCLAGAGRKEAEVEGCLFSPLLLFWGQD